MVINQSYQSQRNFYQNITKIQLLSQHRSQDLVILLLLLLQLLNENKINSYNHGKFYFILLAKYHQYIFIFLIIISIYFWEIFLTPSSKTHNKLTQLDRIRVKMYNFYSLINHKRFQLTTDEFNKLQDKMLKQEKIILGNYIFIAKTKSTEWIHSYKGIHNTTRNYHFIKIYDLTKIVPEQVQLEANRIRKRVRKQMSMNPQHIVKCYQLLENQNYIMVVLQFCAEGPLEDSIIDKKNISLKKSIQWIKQIIYGLSELYTQNIYLENLRPEKILVHEGKCKINDFENLQRRLTMTQEKLVRKHLHELGKMFGGMVFGLKKLGNEEIRFILGQLQRVDALFGVKLLDEIKSFLRLMLNPNQKEMISWQQMIKLQIFHDSQMSISNTNFLRLGQLHPEIYRSSPIHPIQRSLQEKKLLNWDQTQYIEFLKAKLILKKIIVEIDDHQCYELKDRTLLQIVYLLCVRSMNNIKQINLQKDQFKESIFLKYYSQQIQDLQKEILKRFYKYSAQLTKKQSEKLQIGKDFLKKTINIFSPNKDKSYEDKLLTGIQNIGQSIQDYSKMDQILFTVKCIDKFLSKQNSHLKDLPHVDYYLLSYNKIMDIEFEDLSYLMFEQYVDLLVQSEYKNASTKTNRLKK